jgi:hypothetical protein
MPLAQYLKKERGLRKLIQAKLEKETPDFLFHL